ncbi:MAG TPA: sialidase family protein, partial [Myxococcaceae bacterium]
MKIRSVAAMLFAASLGISAVALAEHPPTALARAGVARSGMSSMGKRAAAVVAKIRAQRGATIRLAIPSAKPAPGPARSAAAAAASAALHPPGVSPIPTDAEDDEGEPDCSRDSACLDEGELPAGTQSETSIAIDDSGRHVVIGFNDFRGFNTPQLSVSGFMYSDDGGKTFVDGGQLPDGPLDQFGFPQVFGDPDVKYLGGCNFVYSSIFVIVKSFPGGLAIVQTMSVHRSRDCGHTWEGPFEVTAASNPSGLLDPDGFPVDAADKEFIDVDRHTGRLLMTWTNFTDTSVAPGGTQILSTYSDDFLSATPPTFSTANIISATAREGTGSIPRFGPEKNQAYVVWRRLPGGTTNSIAFAKTDNGGKTWSDPVEISAPFFIIDQILGNDRVHSFPGMAVDKSWGKTRGNIYVAWAGNDSHDGADIMVLRSNNGGKSFIGPVAINARPGGDRAQWFPAVSVDDDTGRVFIHYYDQGLTTSGDLTQVSYVFSDDGGKHWSAPLPLTDPFHGGWGNDTSQPNLGDYNQSVAQRGKYYPVFALASRPPGGFVDGQPDLSMTVPDPKVQVLPASDRGFRAAPLDWQGESF